MSDKKEKSSATLDVDAEASTRTIKASFRRKARLLQSGQAGPVSKKSFQELNEAYQFLIQNRATQADLKTKHVAVISSDVAEYSRMMAEDEAGTLEFFNFCKEVFEDIVAENNGRVFNTAGDAILAEFTTVFAAVDCAIAIQRELRGLNLGQPDGKKILFRMGLNVGDVYIAGDDLLGDAVNIAARLQSAAKPGGICFSGAVHDLIYGRTAHTITSLGEKTFKNIPEPVRTYALTEDDGKFKKPLPDPKIEAVATAIDPRGTASKRGRAEKNGSSAGTRTALAVGALAALAAGVFFFRSGTRPVPTAPQAAPVAAAPAPATGAPAPASVAPPVPDSASAPLGASAGGVAVAPPNLDALQTAAAQGDTEALYRVGRYQLYQLRDEEKAFALFLKAAVNRHSGAQYELGMLYYKREGAPLSKDAAVYWTVKAALGGMRDATTFLAQHEFPPEYKLMVENQRRIDVTASGEEKRRLTQDTMLQDLGAKLQGAGLPTEE